MRSPHILVLLYSEIGSSSRSSVTCVLFLDAVDAARRRIDEALDTLAPGPVGELHGGEAADFPGQLGIEIAAGIVGDARQMNDRVDAVKVDLIRIAHVAPDDREVGMRLEEIAEPHDVEGDDLVAGLQQLRHENAALIAARTSQKNLHLLPCRRPSCPTDYSTRLSGIVKKSNTT